MCVCVIFFYKLLHLYGILFIVLFIHSLPSPHLFIYCGLFEVNKIMNIGNYNSLKLYVSGVNILLALYRDGHKVKDH